MKKGLLCLFALLIALVTVFACNGNTVQEGGLMVVVTSDLGLEDMNSFRLEVSQELEPGKYGAPLIAKDYALPGEASLPATISIAAGKAANQNALIRAIGRKNNAPVVLREAEVRIPTDRLLALTMILSSACANRVQTDPTGKVISTCPNPGESCLPATGACGSSFVDPNTLPTWDSVKDRDAALPIVSLSDAGPVGPRDKLITSFSIAGIIGTITGADIYVTLPPSTNAKGVVPTIVWRGAKIDPSPNVPQDFDGPKPVTYTVTAADGSEIVYTVHVSVASLDDKEILSFEVAGASTTFTVLGSRDEITVKLPFGSDVSRLIPKIVYKGKSVNPGSEVPVDLTKPVTYRVTAFNETTRDYYVDAELADANDAEITSFKINGVKAEVSSLLGSIDLAFTTGVDITNLVPEITFIGKKLDPPSGVAQNFANEVKYTVTSEDGTVETEYVVNIKRPKISPVEFSPASGNYGHAVNVKLSCKTPGVDLRYSTAGDPDLTSALYTAPILVQSGAKTIHARCFSNKYEARQQADFEIFTVFVNAYDGPEELTFGPTKCGTQADPQSLTMTKSGPANTYTAGATPNFLVTPASGSIGPNAVISVQPKIIPIDYSEDSDIVDRLDFTFGDSLIRTVTLRQIVTCP